MLKKIILNTREQYEKASEWLKDYFALSEGIITINDEKNNYKNEDESLEINAYNKQFKFYIDAKSISEGSLLERTIKGFRKVKMEEVLN
jgi:hypothetical protein